jgi:hypothetical protein
MPKGQRPSAHQAAKPHRYGLFIVKTAQLPGLGVVEDFIKGLRPSSNDVRLSLDNQVIQATGLNVIFDLGIPRIGLHFGKPPCKFTLLPMRKLLNLGLDLSYTVHMARVHWRRVLVTSLINSCKNQSPLKRANHFSFD